MMNFLTACLIALLVGPMLSPESRGQDAQGERIRSAIQAGRVDTAIADARRAVAKFPQSSELPQLLGVALFKKDLKSEAREALRRAIDLNSRDPQDYYNLALVELSEKKYPEAVRLLETAVKLDPEDALARAMLGRAYPNQNLMIPRGPRKPGAEFEGCRSGQRKSRLSPRSGLELAWTEASSSRRIFGASS